jgi:FMN phosphatase YigB (HAD superfamily)
MPAVQAVFFDLDDTLLDDDRCWRVAVSLTE